MIRCLLSLAVVLTTDALKKFPTDEISHVMPVESFKIWHAPYEPTNDEDKGEQPYPDDLEVEFHVDGTDFILEGLSLVKDLFSKDAVVSTHHDNGVVKKRKPSLNTYSNGKDVIVLHAEGTFEALFNHDGELHYAEPILKHRRAMLEEHYDECSKHTDVGVVAYKISHVDLKGKFWSYLERTVEGALKEQKYPVYIPRNLGGWNDNTNYEAGSNLPNVEKFDCKGNKIDYALKIGFAADVGFHYEMAKFSDAENAIKMIVATSNAYIFKRQVGLQLEVIEIIVMATTNKTDYKSWNDYPTQDCEDTGKTLCCEDTGTKLSYFATWRYEVKPNEGALWHLMTNCYYQGGTVGRAYLAATCMRAQFSSGGNPPTSGVGVSSNMPGSMVWVTVAHEIGHNYGAEHPFASQSEMGTHKGVMDYVPAGQTETFIKVDGRFIFNPSKNKDNICDEIQKLIDDKKIVAPYSNVEYVDKDKCVGQASAPVCGNGYKEEGEECDGGSCCTSQCKIKEGTECTTEGACCDASTCKIRPSTIACDAGYGAGSGYCGGDGICQMSSCGRYSLKPICGLDSYPCVFKCTSGGGCNDQTNFIDTTTGINLNNIMEDGSKCGNGMVCQSGECISAPPSIDGAWEESRGECSAPCRTAFRLFSARGRCGMSSDAITTYANFSGSIDTCAAECRRVESCNYVAIAGSERAVPIAGVEGAVKHCYLYSTCDEEKLDENTDWDSYNVPKAPTRPVSYTCMHNGVQVAEFRCPTKPSRDFLLCNTDNHCLVYKWEVGQWEECSKPCDGGVRTRTNRCHSYKHTRKQSQGAGVAVSNCPNTHTSEESEACNAQPCATQIYYSEWTTCPTTCVEAGQVVDPVYRSRTKTCVKTLGSESVEVDLSECGETEVLERETCEVKTCEVTDWSVGIWSTCSLDCGGGTQTRGVECRTATDTKPDSECSGEKPATTQECNTQACPIYEWREGAKIPETCPTDCGLEPSILLIRVLCVHTNAGFGEVTVDDNYCTNTKPVTFETCDATELCPVYEWRSSAGECSCQECGCDGTRKPVVTCVQVLADGERQTINSQCNQDDKPSINSTACSGVCTDADFVWTVGPWQACSKGCGTGVMYREVVCKDPKGNAAEFRCKNVQPSTQAPCNGFSCPSWWESDWSECSSVCGTGEQTRTVQCRDHLERLVEQSQCSVSTPSIKRACNSGPCPHWFNGQFGKCSLPCASRPGGGNQTRASKCRMPLDLPEPENGLIVPSSDPRCAEAVIGAPLPTTRTCNVQACTKYIWITDGPETCSKECASDGVAGVITNNYICIDSTSSTTVADAMCTGSRPTNVPCNEQECPVYTYYTGPYAKCSQECGTEGTQHRIVRCMATYMDNGKQVRDFVTPSKCAGQDVPESSKVCNRNADVCGSGVCRSGVCGCNAGAASIKTACDTPGRIISASYNGPDTVPPGEVVSVRWTTQGDIDSVFIVFTSGDKYYQVQHLSNNLFAEFQIPILPAGVYSVLVFYNDDTSMEAKSGLTLVEPCDYISCGAGTCELGVCECPAGYEGTNCEITPCGALDCNTLEIPVDMAFTPVSECVVKDGNAACVCSQGFTGKRCETPSGCTDLQCDQGRPTPTSDGSCPTTCKCNRGFTGAKCDQCSRTCKNGGTPTGECGMCECQEGYSGNLCQCEHAVIKANLGPIPSQWAHQKSKLIRQNFEAALGIKKSDKQVVVKALEDISDNKHALTVWLRGVCFDIDDRYLDPIHFMSNMDGDGGTSTVASNGIMELVGVIEDSLKSDSSILLRAAATAMIEGGSFEIQTPPGYIDLCFDRLCGNGKCEAATGICKCEPGFSGANCGEVDLCHFQDCNSKGTCDPSNGACDCRDGWTGLGCTIQPSVCSGRTCNDQGACSAGYCICKNGYTGGDCEVAPDACYQKDCGGFDRGACISGKCMCFSDFTGEDCELKVDKCASKDCGIFAKDVPCIDGVCQCLDSHSGKLCQTPRPTCSDSFKNGDETGIDCGGSCIACPTCEDGIQNRDEVGIDCGGLKCVPCASCGDGIKNGDETGIDCGGSCASCAAKPTCVDGTKNGDEVGIDCLGSCGGECPAWSVGPWKPCNKDCGGGVQTRDYSCKQNGNQVALSKCDGLHAVASVQTCNEQVCEVFQFTYGDWEECNIACGGGFQYRAVGCTSNLVDVYDLEICKAKLGEPEASVEPCNTEPCTAEYNYKTGIWSECTNFCGGGTQRREIQCVDKTQVTVELANCEGTAPASARNCNEQDCVKAKWLYCGWDECTAECGGGANGGEGGGSMLGIRARDVLCVTDDENESLLARQRCNGIKKEKSIEVGCNANYCTTWNWMTSKWSKCVANEGTTEGTRTRSYHCHSPDGANAKSEECTREIPERTPVAEEPCNIDKCTVITTTTTTTTTEAGGDNNEEDKANGAFNLAAGGIIPALILLSFF